MDYEELFVYGDKFRDTTGKESSTEDVTLYRENNKFSVSIEAFMYFEEQEHIIRYLTVVRSCMLKYMCNNYKIDLDTILDKSKYKVNRTTIGSVQIENTEYYFIDADCPYFERIEDCYLWLDFVIDDFNKIIKKAKFNK